MLDEKIKLCSKCKQEKCIGDFHKDRKRKDGLSVQCKKCIAEKEKERYKSNPFPTIERAKRQRKKRKTIVNELITNIKTNRGCAFCGNKTLCVLDFHHVGKKEKNIYACAYNSHKQFNEEIKKCIVVCANCHRMVHANLLLVEPHMLCTEQWEVKKREWPITAFSIIGGKCPSRKIKPRS